MAKRKQTQASVPQVETVPQDTPTPAPAAKTVTVVDEVLSPEEVRQALAARAQALAQVPPDEEQGATVQVVVFGLGEEVYGIEAKYVEGIYPLDGLTQIPCTPGFVVGVVNLRGRILPIVDLHEYLGLGKTVIDEDTQVIGVNVAGIEVGFLANAVRAVGPLNQDRLEPVLPTTARVAAEYTRGVTSDLLVFLDLEALMQDPRMIVQEEV